MQEQTIKGVKVNGIEHKIDYESLANIPFGQPYLVTIAEDNSIPFTVEMCFETGAEYLVSDDEDWSGLTDFFDALSDNPERIFGVYESLSFFDFVITVDGVDYECEYHESCASFDTVFICPDDAYRRLVPMEPVPQRRDYYPLVDENNPVFIDMGNGIIILAGDTAGTHSVKVSIKRHTEIPVDFLPKPLKFSKTMYYPVFFGNFHI